jgi:hypothetical protein
MTTHARTSLGRILDDLGATLLHPLHPAPPGHTVPAARPGEPGGPGTPARLPAAAVPPGPAEIGGVVIHDPVDRPALPPHALVLGVGLYDPADIAALLADLGRHQAAALVLREPVPADPRVAAAAQASGVAVLELTRGASWTQVAAMLRALLAEGDVGVGDAETLVGTPAGDLFALANAIAALLDAPVTIEDRNSRVLAFSGKQDEADESRVETILGRQVPERFSRALTERGVFRELYRHDEPVYVPPLRSAPDTFTLPRVAVTVRAGDEVLGSIWVAVRRPLGPERSRALQDAARLVALHMLRLRAGADVERRLRADLVSTALEGGAGAREALVRLGLAGQPVVVLALAVPDRAREPLTVGDDAAATTELQRLADAFAVHLSAAHPRCAAAVLGDVVYGLMPARTGGSAEDRADRHERGDRLGGRDRPERADRAAERAAGRAGDPGADRADRALRIATGFLDRVTSRAGAVIGVGPAASDVRELAGSRADADRALRVLRAGRSARRAARLSDVHVEALLLDLRDLVAARGDRPTGPVARLAAYDERHHTDLVETLRAWLDAFGDVGVAAAALHVHPNTFRYRLRRLTEVGGIDLADSEARFAAMLQLRVLPPRPAAP